MSTHDHRDPAQTDRDPAESHLGVTDPGKEFRPDEIEDDEPPRGGRQTSREAPAPGLPISPAEYQRLKDDAAKRRSTTDAPAHEDRPPKG
jgi:hypothetical protein